MRFSETIHHMFENRPIQQITVREVFAALNTSGRKSNLRRNTDDP